MELEPQLKKIETKEYVVEYRDDETIKQAVFDRVLEYFKKHEAYSGEVICQNDRCLLDAPDVLADIADMMFKDLEYKYG